VIGPLAVLNVRGYLELVVGLYLAGPVMLSMWAVARAKRARSVVRSVKCIFEVG